MTILLAHENLGPVKGFLVYDLRVGFLSVVLLPFSSVFDLLVRKVIGGEALLPQGVSGVLLILQDTGHSLVGPLDVLEFRKGVGQFSHIMSDVQGALPR